MTETNVPTLKVRYLLPSATVVELFAFADTPPEVLDNLVQNAVSLDETALAAGLLVANQTAGAQAVAKAHAAGIDGVRDGNGLFHCVSMDILPQADGRTKLAFFGDSHKQPRDDYATVTTMFSPEDSQKKLVDYYEFKVDTLRMAGTFAVDFYVEWYNSNKTNQKGNPYKNFAKLHVKEGAAPPAKAEAPKPPAPAPAQSSQDEIPF